MDKMNYPRGLIRYTTQNAVDGKPTRVLRPRILVYGALLTALLIAFGVALFLRKPVGVDVIRDRNALYRLMDNGQVENVYNVKILNKTERSHRFRITVSGYGDLSLDTGAHWFDVGSGEVYPVAARVRRSAYEPVGSQMIRFAIEADEDAGLHAAVDARFLAPER
jgi:polyferredoxin